MTNTGNEQAAMLPTGTDKASSNAAKTVMALTASMFMVLGLASAAFWRARR